MGGGGPFLFIHYPLACCVSCCPVGGLGGLLTARLMLGSLLEFILNCQAVPLTNASFLYIYIC